MTPPPPPARRAESVLLELITEIHGTLDLAELREGMLAALCRAVPCDWASLNDMGGDPLSAVIINRPPLARKWHALFDRYAHEQPLFVRWLQTRDGRAYRFSDVASENELLELDLFRYVYQPLGVRFQIAITLPSAADRVLAIALSRKRQDFTDEERDLLNAARPFLIQAYRTALEVSRLQDGQGGQAGGGMFALLRGEGLTGRQAQVVVELAHGRSNRGIGLALGISERTVQKHLEAAFRLLGVVNRDEAADRVWSLAGRSTA
jgi:DNA-binding CsgD family transcriptional regulator